MTILNDNQTKQVREALERYAADYEYYDEGAALALLVPAEVSEDAREFVVKLCGLNIVRDADEAAAIRAAGGTK
jgi:hypothetical protein